MNHAEHTPQYLFDVGRGGRNEAVKGYGTGEWVGSCRCGGWKKNDTAKTYSGITRLFRKHAA
jgi:hypothetical protein